MGIHWHGGELNVAVDIDFTRHMPQLQGGDSMNAIAKLPELVANKQIWDASFQEPFRVRMTVTPELAKHWLELSGVHIKDGRIRVDDKRHNRPFLESVARGYGEKMASGRWQYNGQTVIFSRPIFKPNGEVMTGTHRFGGCVLYDVPFDTDVVFGIDPDALPTIDIGRSWSAADHLHVDHLPNASRASSIAKLWLQYVHCGRSSVLTKWAPSVDDVVREVKANSELREYASKVGTFRLAALVPGSILGFCWMLFAEQDRGKADSFVDALVYGANLTLISPVYLLRTRLQANFQGRRKMSPRDKLALMFKTWVAYRDGKVIRCLKWNSHSEEFPTIN